VTVASTTPYKRTYYLLTSPVSGMNTVTSVVSYCMTLLSNNLLDLCTDSVSGGQSLCTLVYKYNEVDKLTSVKTID